MANPQGMMVPGAQDLAVDTAMSVTVSGQPYFITRDSGGFMAVSAICTHMGCTVGFDSTGPMFDCPCHGSQYKIDGTVLQGPATQPLERALLCKNSSGELVIDTSLSVPTTDRLT
jgi:cytochrome b6-f complex iron-sulfur subunit